jgi:lysophospholipase L1-like esterase
MFTRNGIRAGHRGILLTVIVVLAVTVGGMAYLKLPATEGLRSDAAPRDVVPSTSKMFDHQPTLLVVGDSYANSYPDLIADKLGWGLALDVQDGTGFVHGTDNPSPAHAPFVDRLERDAATYHADYVLIDGGRNDLSEPPDQVAAAADEYIKDVRSRWPNAKIIIVLPSYAARDESASYPTVAQGLRRTADTVGAFVIDPVAQHWYTDVEAKFLLGQDGTHLNFNGDTYYADKIIANLTQMFDSKPTLLLVGDSFVGGTGDPGFSSYPSLLAYREHWNIAIDAQGGTGFVHRVDDATPPGVPFIERLDRDAAIYRYRVDYVLIDGGRNDLGDSPEPVLAAADEYAKKVRSIWPNAKIIIVLPSYVTPSVASNYPALAQGLRQTAESVGAQVIDPVAQRWYRDIGVKRLLWKDGVNLNGDGNAYYADKIIENLRRMGVAS